MTDARPALEACVDQMLRICRRHKYTPIVFIGMRRRFGTVQAISRLVQTAAIQDGFRRMVELDLADWTVEAMVLRFPDLFTRDDIACARYRLERAQPAS